MAMRAYLGMVHDQRDLEVTVQRAGRLAFWLVISGICSIMSGATFDTIAVLLLSPAPNNPLTLFSLICVFSYSRIGMTYSQVSDLNQPF